VQAVCWWQRPGQPLFARLAENTDIITTNERQYTRTFFGNEYAPLLFFIHSLLFLLFEMGL